jgi:glycosyltransferase involved in cell wall biosynthesis
MKIAMINTERTRGGAARMAATLAKSLNETGEVRATLFHCEDRQQDAAFTGLRRPGSRQLNAFLARLGGSLCVLDMGVADEIKRRADDADILHLHNLHGYYLDYRKLLNHWGDRPVVWTWHDMWGATGRCGFSDSCEQWQSGCARCPHKEIYPRAWIDVSSHEFSAKSDLLLKRPNIRIVTPSHWLKGIAIKRGYDPSRIAVIANPVDTGKFRPVDRNEARNHLQLKEHEFIALFVASDCGDPRKGYADFAEATRRAGVKALAIGSPPPTAEPHVSHIGRIQDQAELNLYYAAADVMLIPTYSDNYPNTVIEAMASGTPVIGYATGGVPSQIDNDYCALVPTGNVDALTEALTTSAGCGRKASPAAEFLADMARQRWDPRIVTSQYIEQYRQLIGDMTDGR